MSLALLWWLRSLPDLGHPSFFAYMEIVGGVIALACAANSLVRFRGTHDRVWLLVAVGFLLAGVPQAASSLEFFGLPARGAGAGQHVPLAWMLGQGALALLLAVALWAERRIPLAGYPQREIAVALAAVGALAFSASFTSSWAEPSAIFHGLVPRPWHLVLATVFLAVATGYWRRLRRSESALDRTICYAAALAACSDLLASQAVSLLAAPFALAEAAKVASYALLFGGALLDNGRLLEQVHQMATSDPLTGLANYRRLLDVLDLEIRRSQRTDRPFALLLLDLDGLKKINDSQGHLVGSKALIRLSKVLRVDCRETDTPARYGGDEFALVLREAGEMEARQVAARVCQRLAEDGEQPPLSVSVGLALYPRDGRTIEKLLSAADRALYAMKDHGQFAAAARASGGARF